MNVDKTSGLISDAGKAQHIPCFSNRGKKETYVGLIRGSKEAETCHLYLSAFHSTDLDLRNAGHQFLVPFRFPALRITVTLEQIRKIRVSGV